MSEIARRLIAALDPGGGERERKAQEWVAKEYEHLRTDPQGWAEEAAFCLPLVNARKLLFVACQRQAKQEGLADLQEALDRVLDHLEEKAKEAESIKEWGPYRPWNYRETRKLLIGSDDLRWVQVLPGLWPGGVTNDRRLIAASWQ